MPNYLEGNQTKSVTTTSGSPADAPKTNVSSGSEKVPLDSGGTNTGGGSKPMALHTEYATGESEGPAYGSQDIIFYLQRADIDDQEGSPSQDREEQSKAANPGISSDGGTGPNADKGSVPSGVNNLAMNGVAGKNVDGAAMAPIGGMTIEDEEPVGAFSQNASKYVDVSAAAANAVRYVESLGSDYMRVSLAASERMFANVLSRGYNPDIDLTGTRDEETILGALERPSLSELAFLLAQQTGGLSRAKDVVKAVNNGDIGLVTAKARAFQSRSGMSKGSNR